MRELFLGTSVTTDKEKSPESEPVKQLGDIFKQDREDIKLLNERKELQRAWDGQLYDVVSKLRVVSITESEIERGYIPKDDDETRILFTIEKAEFKFNPESNGDQYLHANITVACASASDELLIVKAAISVVAFTQPPPKNKKKPLSTCFGYPQAGNPSYKCNVSVERGADIAVDRSGPSLSCHITQTSAVDYVQHGIKVTAKDRATINPSNRNDKNPIRKLWVLELNQLSAKKKFDIRESLSESEVPSWARMLTHDCGVTWKLPTNLLSKDGLFVLIQAYVTARERKKPFLHDVICKVRTFETKFKLTAVEKSNYLIVHCIPRQPVTTSYKATKAWSFKTRRNVAMNETVWRWTDEKKRRI